MNGRKLDVKLGQAMVERKKVEVRLEWAMEDERKRSQAKMSELVEESRRLERELDAVRETADDTAEWIATGVRFLAALLSTLLIVFSVS
jgi:hypothetical protein